MKRNVTKYIKNFFDNLSQSKKTQHFYSKESVPFDKDALFSKITNMIASEESHTRIIPFYRKHWFIAASFIGAILLAYYSYSSLFRKTDKIELKWVTSSTSSNDIDSLVLDDGTKVWLNINSSISYPEHFDAWSREVVLVGEAYFDVTHDPGKPFIIRSGNINTTVLGTSFDVNAYQDNTEINVTVKTGKVQVTDSIKETQPVLIRPRQQLSFHKESRLFSLKKDVNLANSIGWHKNQLIFEDKTLEDIIPILNRKYKTRIEIDSSLYKFEITANFEGETLDNVLKVLSIITNQSVIKKGDAIILQNK